MEKKFNEQQLAILEDWNTEPHPKLGSELIPGIAVVAGAGCGKTTTLVEKCLRYLKRELSLTQQDPTYRPRKFLAVSFTEKSVQDLKSALQGKLTAQALGTSQDPYRRYAQVQTIHGFCLSVIQEFPEAAGCFGSEKLCDPLDSERLWDRALLPLWSQGDSPKITQALLFLNRLYGKNDTIKANLKQLKSLSRDLVSEFISRSEQDFNPESSEAESWALAVLLDSVLRRYDHLKWRQNVLEYNDLETLALKALETPAVHNALKSRFGFIVVDEFQDTNPIQGKILKTLAPSVSGASVGFQERGARARQPQLMVVGDPKQSIYRFRSADVSVFYSWVESLSTSQVLTTNYRSSPDLIHVVNAICEPLFQASGLIYDPLIAGLLPQSSPPPNSLDVLDPRGVCRLTADSPADLARFFKVQMQKNPEKLSEWAVLVRKTTGRSAEFVRELKRLNVPFVLGSGGKFFSDPRAVEVISFLRAYFHPEDHAALVQALFAPAWNWTIAQLEEHLRDPVTGKRKTVALSELVRFHHQPKRGSTVAPFQYSVFDLLDEWALRDTTGEYRAILQKIAEMITEQVYAGEREDEVVDQLYAWTQLGIGEKDIVPPQAQGVLQVMTIHASKGLEFKHVVVFDFQGAHRSPAKNDDIWIKDHQKIILTPRLVNGKKDDKNPVLVDLKEQEKKATIAESKRLFYVALTRAKASLHFFWLSVPDEKEANDPLNQDNWRAWVDHYLGSGQSFIPVVSLPDFIAASSSDFSGLASEDVRDGSPKPLLAEDKKNSGQAPVVPVVRPRVSPSDLRTYRMCPQRYVYQTRAQLNLNLLDSDRDVSSPRSLDSAPLGESATDIGTRLHKSLEEGDFLACAEVIGEATAHRVWERREALKSEGRILREYGFEVPLSRSFQAVTGQMDLCVVSEDLSWAKIIDYKFSRKPKTESELLDLYLPQVQAYAWALCKGFLRDGGRVSAEFWAFSDGMFSVVPVPDQALSPPALEQVWADFLSFEKVLETWPTGKSWNHRPWARPGDECPWCPYRSACVAWVS